MAEFETPYKIYGLFDSETNELIYIGCTVFSLNERLNSHFSRARNGDDKPLYEYIREKDFEVHIQLISCKSSRKEMYNIEKILIEHTPELLNVRFREE